MKNTSLTSIVAGMALCLLFFFPGQGQAQNARLAWQQADQLYWEADSLFGAQQDSLSLVKYQQAKALYIRNDLIKPNLVDACVMIGTLFQIQEKFDQAIGAYKESLRHQRTIQPQVDTSYFYPYILIASCYIHVNQYDSAYAYYGKVEPLLARYPKISQAQRYYNDMGVLFETFGNYTQSINYLEQALKTIHFDPRATSQPHQFKVIRYVMYNSNIARCLSKLGHYRQAIDKAKGLIRYQWIPHILYQNIASAYLQMQQPDSAAMYLKKIDFRAPTIINPNKTKVEYYYSLGQVYLQKKDSRQAFVSFNKARQLSQQYYGFKNNHLALAYAGKGQVYEGLHVYGQALRNYQSALQALHFNFKDADIYHNPAAQGSSVSPLLLFKVLGYKAQAFRQYYRRTREVKDLAAALQTYQVAFELSDLTEGV
jgi:tetratricopeptide (TPR) repeat protein